MSQSVSRVVVHEVLSDRQSMLSTVHISLGTKPKELKHVLVVGTLRKAALGAVVRISKCQALLCKD